MVSTYQLARVGIFPTGVRVANDIFCLYGINLLSLSLPSDCDCLVPLYGGVSLGGVRLMVVETVFRKTALLPGAGMINVPSA